MKSGSNISKLNSDIEWLSNRCLHRRPIFEDTFRFEDFGTFSNTNRSEWVWVLSNQRPQWKSSKPKSVQVRYFLQKILPIPGRCTLWKHVWMRIWKYWPILISKVQKSEVEMKMLIFLLSRHNTWSHHPTVSVSNKDKSRPLWSQNAVELTNACYFISKSYFFLRDIEKNRK